jgi:predicted small secreted protein
MKTTYGFEDVTRSYLDVNVTEDTENGTYMASYRSNTINPRIIGDYSIVLDAETLSILCTDWALKDSYHKQGRTTSWKTADLWSAYEYNQYATLRMEAKEIIEQAGDRWSLSFGQQAAYDALYRQAGYDRTQYFHGVPSALDISLEEAIKIANSAIEKKFRIEKSILENAELTYEFDVSDETLCNWRLRILVITGREDTMYTVVIDSRSGEVLSITSQIGSN